jgi:hypothetical protein
MQLRAEAGGSVRCEESAAAGRHVDDARELVPRVRWLGALRLVLGGHCRAPQRYGPRLCAQHQSLRPNIVTPLWDYPLTFHFPTVLRLVFDTAVRCAY